ncbi:MAG: hypothetical protein KA257_12875 [Opitutaceae bacterium]|nr:hypothetical protein [Opitutaceae bacterium]
MKKQTTPPTGYTKVAAVVSCILFLVAASLTPGPGSSIGMPWPLFLLTWGAMLIAATIVLVGYSASKDRGHSVSVFYLICPLTLMTAFLLLVYLRG